jgi:hypothetical protein
MKAKAVSLIFGKKPESLRDQRAANASGLDRVRDQHPARDGWAPFLPARGNLQPLVASLLASGASVCSELARSGNGDRGESMNREQAIMRIKSL